MRAVLLFGLLGLSVAGICQADETIEVVRSEGVIEVGEPGKAPLTDSGKRYVFTTGANGRAVVRVGDSGFVVVERNSTLELNRSSSAANVFRQVSGMIYYAMNKVRHSTRAVEVKTKTAVIGVRGTRFVVVEQENRKEIGMRKGVVSVTSTSEEFEIHRKQVEDEFFAYKKEAREAIAREKQAFETYRANTEREFVEYKRQFTLDADRMVSFDGRRVTEGALGERTRHEMESLESYGAEWIGQVRD